MIVVGNYMYPLYPSLYIPVDGAYGASYSKHKGCATWSEEDPEVCGKCRNGYVLDEETGWCMAVCADANCSR